MRTPEPNQELDQLLETIVGERQNAHGTIRQILERLSESYRSRLAKEGKLDQSTEAVLEELRAVRLEVPVELYP